MYKVMIGQSERSREPFQMPTTELSLVPVTLSSLVSLSGLSISDIALEDTSLDFHLDQEETISVKLFLREDTAHLVLHIFGELAMLSSTANVEKFLMMQMVDIIDECTMFRLDHRKTTTFPFIGKGENGICIVRGGESPIIILNVEYCQQESFEKVLDSYQCLKGFIRKWIFESLIERTAFTAFMNSVEDQDSLRCQVREANGVSFIPNGAILPRSITSMLSAIPFVSPESLEHVFRLPNYGEIKGMLIPRGVTVIVGGGYHGKSTLLRAISNGVYNKMPGDQHELIVTDESAVYIRAEEQRSIKNVDITPFLNGLPAAANIDPSHFSTDSASGSTSMAASVIESIEMNASAFLLDEDVCASNFMLRCSRMRSLISNETCVPYIYRVNSLSKALNISTIIVSGCSGDWFDVQDLTLMMDNYVCKDVSRRACSISKTFSTGRVTYNGKGLVHQLSWPVTKSSTIRKVDIRSLQLSTDQNISLSPSISASEDGKSLFYGSTLIDLSTFEQKINCEEGALGIGLAMFAMAELCLKSSSSQEVPLFDESSDGNLTTTFLSISEILKIYETCNVDIIFSFLSVFPQLVGNKRVILPRSFELGLAINRYKHAIFEHISYMDITT